MYKFNKIVVLLAVLIVFGISSCTNETPTPTSMQNQSNTQIATSTDKGDNNQIAVTTGENKSTGKKSENPKGGRIAATLTISWDGRWYTFCFFGPPDCSMTITIPLPFLTIPVAEPILGYTLPENAVPVVFQSLDGKFDHLEDGYSGEIVQHEYFPGDPRIIGGTIDTPIIFPPQTVVYSTEYQGFIGYFIEQ
jgi:hypothetical protein